MLFHSRLVPAVSLFATGALAVNQICKTTPTDAKYQFNNKPSSMLPSMARSSKLLQSLPIASTATF